MLVRLFALLITLGLFAGSVQASDLVVHDTVVHIDEVEDASEIELAVTAVGTADLDRTIRASAPGMEPLPYQHLLFVFRPPRAPLN